VKGCRQGDQDQGLPIIATPERGRRRGKKSGQRSQQERSNDKFDKIKIKTNEKGEMVMAVKR
jgi:hypothetical protein